MLKLKTGKLLKTGLYFTVSQALVAGTNLLVVLIFTPQLGANGFGEISLLWMIVLFTSLFVDSRLNTAISLKFYKLNIKERSDFILSIYLYYIFASILLIIFPFNVILSWILNISISYNEWLIIVGLVFSYVLSTFYTNFLVLTHKGTEYFISKFSWSFIFLVSSLYFTSLKQISSYDYLLSLIISYGFIAIVGLIRIDIWKSTLSKKLKYLYILRSLLIVSMPLIIEGLITTLLAWSDRYMVQYFLGLSMLGIYSFAYRFSDAINSLILNPIGQVLSPSLLKVYNKDQQEFRLFYDKIASIYLLIAVSVGLVFQFGFRIVFKYFIISEFNLSSHVVDFLILGALVLGFGNILAFNILASENTKKLARINILTLLVSFLIGSLLTYGFGVYGAGMAMIITYIIFNYLLLKNQPGILDVSGLFIRNRYIFIMFVCLYSTSFLLNCFNIYNLYIILINGILIVLYLLFLYRKNKIIYYKINEQLLSFAE